MTLTLVASPPGMTPLCSSVPVGPWLLCSGRTEVGRATGSSLIAVRSACHRKKSRRSQRGHRLPSFSFPSAGHWFPQPLCQGSRGLSSRGGRRAQYYLLLTELPWGRQVPQPVSPGLLINWGILRPAQRGISSVRKAVGDLITEAGPVHLPNKGPCVLGVFYCPH